MVVSTPPQGAGKSGLAELARTVSPEQIRVVYSVSNALPYRVEWSCRGRTSMVYGLSPDDAAGEALSMIQRGDSEVPRDQTAPTGAGEYADAVRELIQGMQPEPVQRPQLRLVR